MLRSEEACGRGEGLTEVERRQSAVLAACPKHLGVPGKSGAGDGPIMGSGVRDQRLKAAAADAVDPHAPTAGASCEHWETGCRVEAGLRDSRCVIGLGLSDCITGSHRRRLAAAACRLSAEGYAADGCSVIGGRQGAEQLPAGYIIHPHTTRTVTWSDQQALSVTYTLPHSTCLRSARTIK